MLECLAQIQGVSQEDRTNRRFISKIQAAVGAKPQSVDYSYTERDIILYNLGIGAKRNQRNLVFEGNKDFTAVPTFGVVPAYFSKASWTLNEVVPNYDQRRMLHGEQYLEILQWPIPTSATLKTSTKLIEVVDKGTATIVRRGQDITDSHGKPVFYNESVLFIRGSGNFGGQKTPSNRGPATAVNNPPKRDPDHVVEEQTSPDLAAIYRLMGDRNPLHIDPVFSKAGGFETPILHGLATFGITGKHVFGILGAVRSFKVRFAGVVIPGQTIVTEMWRVDEGRRVVYKAWVKETGKVCISNAAAEVWDGGEARL